MDYRKMMSRLNNALNQVNSAYAFIAKKYGLTYNALMALYIVNECDNITQKIIGDTLYLSKSTVHSILLDLQKKKYVELKDGNNKKEKIIVFTKEGEKLFSLIINDTEIFEQKVLDFFGEESCATFIEQAENMAAQAILEIKNLNVGSNCNED